MTGRSPFDRSAGFQSVRDSEAEFAPPRKTSKHCCCLPIWLCFILILFIFGGIAVSLYFLWPRLPTLSYVSTNSNFDLSSKNIQKTSNNLKFTLNSTLDLYNPNYIPLYLNNVTLQLSIPTPDHNSIKVGDGFLPSGVSFPARSREDFNVLTDITLDVTTQDANNKAAMLVILQGCTNHDKIPINYYVKSDVPLVSWTGYQPSFNGQFSIDCPLASKIGI